ncbi:MAG: hypothetical protein KIT56_05170, partial [Gammaproteobacteria bacterium]|nr:hypothetical protein [Gammaproteobacteria bacterium]
YPVMSKQDFNREWDWDTTIHQYGDIGIDLLVNVDKNQWFTHPVTWWVPVSDLVEVYHRMGKDEYTAKEIIWGNQLIYYAGYGERLVSAPAYPYLRWKMPWTSQHYYDWPEGGIVMDEEKVTEYLMALWARLNNKDVSTLAFYTAPATRFYTEKNNETVTVDFAKQAIEHGDVEVVVIHQPDGSVELQPPVVKSFIHFQQLLIELFSKIVNGR